uniref:Endonuclease/exonuclease/phosphatase domain-containing protein n=1 Tax=Strigamia maritima TaxID=126957 RepID=T1IT28_STRMM
MECCRLMQQRAVILKDDLFSWDFLPATRSKKKGRAKGGQLIGVRRSLDWSWKCEKWQYGLVIRYQVEADRGILVSVYCHEGITWLAEELDLILEEAEDMGWQVMIMGDFNARTANQQVDLGDTHDVRNSEDDTINEEGRLLLKFCGDHGIKILNGMTDGDWNAPKLQNYRRTNYKHTKLIQMCDRVMTQAHGNGPRHVPLVDSADMTTSGQDRKSGKAGRGRADPGTVVVREPATSADMHWPSSSNSLVSAMKPGIPVLWAPPP